MHFKLQQKLLILGVAILMGEGLFFVFLFRAAHHLQTVYVDLASRVVLDRTGAIISIQPNNRGYYALYLDEFPKNLESNFIQKEDQYFFWHLGFNPYSIGRSVARRLLGQGNRGGSTLTQQVAKILLGNENNRSFKNKLHEAFYTLVLEVSTTKKQLLTMYGNIIFLGNGTQGVETASRLYFERSAGTLGTTQSLQLAATGQNPNLWNPLKEESAAATRALAAQLQQPTQTVSVLTPEQISRQKIAFNRFVTSPTAFELRGFIGSCQNFCQTNIDQQLTEKLRAILARNLNLLRDKKVRNGAIAVLKQPENELIALIGSPDPTGEQDGAQINLARSARPIGSTFKPFIYLKAFEAGLRPYTIVNDREYRYTVGAGFSFYPKNYDRDYRGNINLHYALNNSLNVPSVKVLEFLGSDFNNFLLHDLEFKPRQPLENYDLGIALGGLEMDLLRLTYYFSIFTNQGKLTTLRVGREPAKEFPIITKPVAKPGEIQLVNKILTDHLTGSDQFGQVNNLTLPYSDYAVKTGTSRDFHDSWTIGYTPDFIVGVWVGNSDNTATDEVSGTLGAGRIWQESMQALLSSPYNHNRKFNFDLLTPYQTDDLTEFGLGNDNYELMKQALSAQSELILTPHIGDVFLWETTTAIRLRSTQKADWTIGDELFKNTSEFSWHPPAPGVYMIQAQLGNKTEQIQIQLNLRN